MPRRHKNNVIKKTKNKIIAHTRIKEPDLPNKLSDELIGNKKLQLQLEKLKKEEEELKKCIVVVEKKIENSGNSKKNKKSVKKKVADRKPSNISNVTTTTKSCITFTESTNASIPSAVEVNNEDEKKPDEKELEKTDSKVENSTTNLESALDDYLVKEIRIADLNEIECEVKIINCEFESQNTMDKKIKLKIHIVLPTQDKCTEDKPINTNNGIKITTEQSQQTKTNPEKKEQELEVLYKRDEPNKNTHNNTENIKRNIITSEGFNKPESYYHKHFPERSLKVQTSETSLNTGRIINRSIYKPPHSRELEVKDKHALNENQNGKTNNFYRKYYRGSHIPIKTDSYSNFRRMNRQTNKENTKTKSLDVFHGSTNQVLVGYSKKDSAEEKQIHINSSFTKNDQGSSASTTNLIDANSTLATKNTAKEDSKNNRKRSKNKNCSIL